MQRVGFFEGRPFGTGQRETCEAWTSAIDVEARTAAEAAPRASDAQSEASYFSVEAPSVGSRVAEVPTDRSALRPEELDPPGVPRFAMDALSDPGSDVVEPSDVGTGLVQFISRAMQQASPPFLYCVLLASS